MWCPKCRNEYIEGVTTCVDCGCELVDELPEEIDKDAPQIIGSVIDEATGNKFIRFFRFSGLTTCSLIPHEEDEGFDLAVAYPELEYATELVTGFAQVEAMDDVNLEELMPVLEERLAEIQDEEANELLTDLRTEVSTVYVNKKDKYADFKFSGYSFLVFAAIGYILVALNLAGALPVLLFNNYSMIILFIVFTIFLGIGISSLRKAAKIKNLVSEEDLILEKVEAYMDEHFTDEYFASLIDADLPDEENFFQVTETLKNEIIKEFPLFHKEYTDQLVDERYDDYCNRLSQQDDE